MPFINLAKLLFYVSVVNEIFIKMQPNMLLNSSLGDSFVYSLRKSRLVLVLRGLD